MAKNENQESKSNKKNFVIHYYKLQYLFIFIIFFLIFGIYNIQHKIKILIKYIGFLQFN
jgi:hypothetical protein